MDVVDRLIQAFRARATSSPVARLDVLIDLERLADCRVVPFLMDVVADRRESTPVRSHVLKRLRNGRLKPGRRPSVASALLDILADAASPQLQLDAAIALGEFVDLAGVPAALGCAALDPALPLDLRYSAFTSLERAGPTPECVALLRQLSHDDTLGRSAHSALSTWGLL